MSTLLTSGRLFDTVRTMAGLNHEIDELRLYKTLGQNIRELRATRQGDNGLLTQAELAKAVGLERTSITNLEKGSQKVPLHVLYAVCRVLEVDVADVLPPLTEVTRRETATQLDLVSASVEQASVGRPLLSKVLEEMNSDSTGEDDGN